MTIGIVVTNFGRPKILEIFCAGIKRLREEAKLEIPCVCTGDIGGAEICNRYDIQHIEYPNKPLTDKFNRSCSELRGKVDYIMVMGSDDLISTDTFMRIHAECEKGTDMVGLSEVYFFCMDGEYAGDLIHFKHTTVLGVGRTVKASVLDNLNWRPWTTSRDRGIDVIMLDAVRPYVKTSELLHGGLVFDLKSSNNLNQVFFWRKRLGKMPSSDLFWNILGKEETILVKEFIDNS